jgi:hypothetical protein
MACLSPLCKRTAGGKSNKYCRWGLESGGVDRLPVAAIGQQAMSPASSPLLLVVRIEVLLAHQIGIGGAVGHLVHRYPIAAEDDAG